MSVSQHAWTGITATGALVSLFLTSCASAPRSTVAAPQAPDEAQTEQVAQDYGEPPRLLRQTRPIYPEEAFRNHVEGTVVVEILISKEGRVVRERTIQSIPELDRAALECVRSWFFQPAVKDGVPVATVAHAPVTFKIFAKERP